LARRRRSADCATRGRTHRGSDPRHAEWCANDCAGCRTDPSTGYGAIARRASAGAQSEERKYNQQR